MWHINAGWWLHFFLLPALVIAAGCSALILIARSHGWASRPFVIAAAALIFLAALAVRRVARRKFFRLDDALVRIESNARLNNRLTCARAAVGEWPEFDANAGAGLRWNFRRILIPLAAAAICLAGSALVPIRSAADAASHEIQEPSAWTQTQQWMDSLKQDEVVQPKDLDAIKDQLDALRRQPKDQWYGHNSLEAGDQLRDQTQQGIQELDRNLELADSALSQLMQAAEEQAGALGKDGKEQNGANGKSGDGKNGESKTGNGLDKQTQEALQKQMEKVIAGLKSGSLKLDPKTMQQLSKIDPSKLKMIDPKQLKECKAKLSKCSSACKNCTLGKGGKDAQFAVLVEAMAHGNSTCNKPGAGGPGGGGPPAQLTFSKTEEKAKLDGQEGVSSSSMADAAIGDTVGVINSAHKVDQSEFKGLQSGGAAQAGGAGEAVWITEVLPEEQAALERYFSEKK